MRVNLNREGQREYLENKKAVSYAPSFEGIHWFDQENAGFLLQILEAGCELFRESLSFASIFVHFVAPPLGAFIL